MSLASQLNWACNFVVGLVFPYMNEYLGPYSFVPFAMILLGVFVFTWVALPETQGTTPEQLAVEMKRSLSQMFTYAPNTEAASLDAEWRKAMEQLQLEEENERKQGTYDYGFQPIPSESERHHVPSI
jgi:MFS transporter, SP family, solute carrier family 2 (facilitated glucose transporter), member 3